MSKILSIYNDWAFSEVVLPITSNIEYSFLLDATLFHLSRNELISLECIQGKWKFAKSSQYFVELIGQPTCDGNFLCRNERYNITTISGETMTILIEEKDNPLNVYNKYIFKPGEEISIGINSDNNIIYRYPNDNNVKNFVSHCHCKIINDGKNTFVDDYSSNGTYINNIRVNGRQILGYGDSIRVFGLNIIYLGNILAINNASGVVTDLKFAQSHELESCEKKGNKAGSSSKIKFFRAPRIVPKMCTETVTIDPPPNPKEIPNIPMFMQIGPAMTMAMPMILGSGLTIAASKMSGAANSSMMLTGIITAVASAIIGTFWALMNIRFNRKTVQEGEKLRFEKYGRYLIEKQDYIETLYKANSEAYREKYASPDEITSYDSNSEKLWNRNFNHSDVLTYRLGIGEVSFPVSIEIPATKFSMIDDSLAEKPGKIKNYYRVMRDVPVCLNIKENNIVGIIGEMNSWAQIVKNLIVQIAGCNSYTDVKIVFIFDAMKVPNHKEWEFVKWLPHVWSEDKKIRYYATNKNEANEIFYSLSQTMRNRYEEEDASCKPYYILFVLNKELLEGELITKYIVENSNEYGLSTIITAEKYEQLPNSCEFIIENNMSFSGIYSTVDENVDQISVLFDNVTDNKVLSFAKRLANIEVDESENGGEIPNSISFFEMYGISKPEELESAERWRKSKTSDSMKAIIGFKNGMNPCYLDIHERYHGPHGLVAGTTGSGKSETLQTYILSLAINYSPNDVGFFIIDYKGGGMANLFSGLPHVIGAISNLSGNQVKRAMVSIKSENKRRQRMFSEHGVNNISNYTALYKNGDAKEPIPHMLIIIDEFAELKREEPDFMRELVSVAQVGRSLGVHLILATQKPAGTVDDNIWSNSKFKLCLRVQDRQDSMDMLHRVDAAYLTQAGRGYLQVGNDELYEMFQSGYSGATYDEALGNSKLVVAQILNSIGKVDLVGNHFKIKYQEKVLYDWVTILYKAVKQARELTDESEVDNEDAFINSIYKNISLLGAEYKESFYNSVRLKEFAKLVQSEELYKENDPILNIIDNAQKKGIRLPELKNKTQLEAINEYLAEVAMSNGYNHNFTLWMPVLPEHLTLSEIDGYGEMEYINTSEWTLSAIVGKGDDPENQSQMAISIDFANNGHHVICGTVSTGKSTFLQTAIYSLINKYTSDEINIYIIDFSSKVLGTFYESKHVGGIMTDSEEDVEKISKFFTMLTKVLEERKKIFSGSNYKDYTKVNGIILPAIIIVIDNYAGFKEKTEEKYEDLVRQIAKEGINYGIFLLVSAAGFGVSELSTRLAENFRTTICLEMSDIYQYSDVMRVVKVPVYPEVNVKGRGLVFYGDKIIEFQTAVACAGDGVFERNENIKQSIQRINSVLKSRSAKRIPVIPDKPTWEEYIMQDDYANLIATKELLPNGYNAVTAAYSCINLTSLLTYAISGTKKSGKSTYMKVLIQSFIDKLSDVCIIEIGTSEFQRIANEVKCRYISDGEGMYEYAKSVLLAEAGIRAKKKTECLALQLEDEEFFEEMLQYKRHCVFIPNMPGFLKELYNRESLAFDAVNVYETLVGEKGFHYNFYFFAEFSDGDVNEILGYKFTQSFVENGTGIRFGGKYLSQKLFNFANIPYKNQGLPLKPGIGAIPCEEENVLQEQIIVPNYKG